MYFRIIDTGTRRYGVPADAISVPADSGSEIVKFTISTPPESCTNAKAKYSSSVVPPDPSVHFYHCIYTYGNSRFPLRPYWKKIAFGQPLQDREFVATNYLY